MAAARTFLRKYWILVVIVLWVIAWANRDWLAGHAPSGEDAYAEAAPVEGPVAVRDVEAEAVAVAEPSPPAPEARRAELTAPDRDPAASLPAQPEATPEPTPEPTPQPTPGGAGGEAVAEAEATTEAATTEQEVGPPAAPMGSMTAAPMTEPLVETEAAAAPASGVVPAELLSRAYSAARNRGPAAAAAVLAAGLRELPADVPGRADLYGEMGNYHFAAGNFTAALAAYDSALRVLPEEERGTMLRRLAPVYDRYHPVGRSHLEQFR
ncbi:tetratricopeptide repeat protein [Thioalkalivibrio sp.]|uniref:tetratricopeptide repeat protein n=1 Tax=Thioalkalivibrio sp. TaxID=2093813 RepID=UPI0039756FF9